MIPLLLILTTAPSCSYVSGDRILARDLASVVPAFGKLPPGLPLAYAPAPGQMKTIATAELRQLGKANGIDAGQPANACFVWKMHVPTDAELLSAMQFALRPRTVEIKIVERSRFPVPDGPLVFALPPLSGGNRALPITWRGSVTYAPHKTWSLWARVVLEGSGTRVVAAERLSPDVPIRAAQLRLEHWSGPLASLDSISSLEEVVGLMPKASLPDGAPIESRMLAKPPDVMQGDTVEVRVNWGHAHVKTDGVAEQAGSVGAMIRVRNVASGKRFRARVDGKDLVSVNTRIGG